MFDHLSFLTCACVIIMRQIELDVLDDLKGEAKEVCSKNHWLSYTDNLHRVREWGSVPKLFDLLDERTLSLTEAHQFIGLVLGKDAVSTLPDIQVANAYIYHSLFLSLSLSTFFFISFSIG
jgi:hypothetical protein